jgi:hypothetical protein
MLGRPKQWPVEVPRRVTAGRHGAAAVKKFRAMKQIADAIASPAGRPPTRFASPGRGAVGRRIVNRAAIVTCQHGPTQHIAALSGMLRPTIPSFAVPHNRQGRGWTGASPASGAPGHDRGLTRPWWGGKFFGASVRRRDRSAGQEAPRRRLMRAASVVAYARPPAALSARASGTTMAGRRQVMPPRSSRRGSSSSERSMSAAHVRPG